MNEWMEMLRKAEKDLNAAMHALALRGCKIEVTTLQLNTLGAQPHDIISVGVYMKLDESA